MPRIEQAVFTSIGNGRAAGYEVVASSPGVCKADCRELAVWGPSHDSMLDSSPEGESFNFHPLPSGAYCISRSVALGGQWQGGQDCVYTQCLIVPPEELARFDNNPFALIHAVSAAGGWQVHQPPCPPLKPLLLTTGGANAVDQALLAFLAADPGPENMAALVQAARDAVCLALGGRPSTMPLMAGLFICLPPECRLEFSFSTGLKFSPRRPFRLVGLAGDPAERCWIGSYPNVTVMELRGGNPPPSMPLDGWARLVRQALSTGRIPFLAAQVSQWRFHLTLDDLPALGLQLLEDIEASQRDGREEIVAASAKSPLSPRQRGDAAHQRFAKSVERASAAVVSAASPTADVDPDSPAVLEKLELLDDLIYEAICGHPGAMERLLAAWPKLAEELGEPLLAASREQYLRYALSIWEDSAPSDGAREPGRAIVVLDILCLLFDGAT
jgi:hypothetical protein